MKILQINIWAGRYLEEITKLIKSEDYDFICMQELAAGRRFQVQYKGMEPNNLEKYPSEDCFQELKARLTDWEGILSKTFTNTTQTSYLGNAIFFKKRYKAIDIKEIIMSEERIVEDDDNDYLTYPHKAVSLEFQKDEQKLRLITGHFYWTKTPYDTHTSIKKAHKVFKHLKDLKTPFILAGDFNVDYRTITCSQFEAISRNLTKQLDIKNTLNPNLHKTKAIFPEGIACDQVFVSPEIDVSGFRMIKEDLSDHYGLELEFEFHAEDRLPIGELRD